MKEFHWALEVAGTSFDLEDAVAIFGEESDPTVRRIEVGEGEAPITILTSPQMEALSTPDHVLGVANRLLSLVNGALFVRGAEREPLKITGLRSRRAGGNWDQHLVQEETVIARDRFGAVVVRHNDEPAPKPEPALRWVAAAQSDQILADVLTYLDGEPDWFDLYKAFEMMRDDINQRMGQHREAAMGWPKKGAIDHFRLSTGVYRHAPPWNGGYTTEKAMTLAEARRFIQSLTGIWLNWRLP